MNLFLAFMGETGLSNGMFLKVSLVSFKVFEVKEGWKVNFFEVKVLKFKPLTFFDLNKQNDRKDNFKESIVKAQFSPFFYDIVF